MVRKASSGRQGRLAKQSATTVLCRVHFTCLDRGFGKLNLCARPGKCPPSVPNDFL